MILHEIRRPNSLKTVPSGVANCRNLPFGRRVRKRPLRWAKGASSNEGKCVELPPTFIQGKHRKNQNRKVKGLRILKMRVRESCTHGEGIIIPRTRHKGWQPLIECANHDFNIIYFPFYIYYLFPFLLFFFFSCFFTFFGVDKGIALTLTYPRVR